MQTHFHSTSGDVIFRMFSPYLIVLLLSSDITAQSEQNKQFYFLMIARKHIEILGKQLG